MFLGENHEAGKCPGLDEYPVPGTDNIEKCVTNSRGGMGTAGFR